MIFRPINTILLEQFIAVYLIGKKIDYDKQNKDNIKCIDDIWQQITNKSTFCSRLFQAQNITEATKIIIFKINNYYLISLSDEAKTT